MRHVHQLRQTYGPDQPHPVFRELHLDNAGEQRDDCTEFQNAMLNMSGGAVALDYGDPSRKNSTAAPERHVQVHEMGTKAILLQNNLPAEDWPYAEHNAMWLRNRYPLARNIKSRDGDAIRPLEQISNGRYSRRMCNHDLKHFVAFGTPCLISTPDVKGSNIENASRQRWGIAHSMVRGLPRFKDPWTNSLFRSKDFTIVPLSKGQNYREFFNLPQNGPKVTTETIPKNVTTTTNDQDFIEDIITESPTSMEPESDEEIKNNPPENTDFDSEIKKLHTNPKEFIGRPVFRHWIQDEIDYGVCKGIVTDYDEDNAGPDDLPWGIQWMDEEFTNFGIDPAPQRVRKRKGETDEEVAALRAKVSTRSTATYGT